MPESGSATRLAGMRAQRTVSPGLPEVRDLQLPRTEGSGELTLLQTWLCYLICKASNTPRPVFQ